MRRLWSGRDSTPTCSTLWWTTVERRRLVNAELIDQVTFTRSWRVRVPAPADPSGGIRVAAQGGSFPAAPGPRGRDSRSRARGSRTQTRRSSREHLEAAGDLLEAYDWHMRAGGWAQHRDVRAARTSWRRRAMSPTCFPATSPTERRHADRAASTALRQRLADSGATSRTRRFDELRRTVRGIDGTTCR